MVIETTGLTKRYGKHVALSHFDCHLPQGSFCALLGRNGAGKTTALSLLLGERRAQGGEVRVLGVDPWHPMDRLAMHRSCAYVAQDRALLDSHTGRQHMAMVQSLKMGWDQARAEELMRAFHLPLDKKMKDLSKGQQGEWALTLALARNVALLVLDEPFEGLDPLAREQAMQALVRLTALQGTTVLLATHRLEDVETLADRVCILVEGRVALAGALSELQAQYAFLQARFPHTPPDVFKWAGVLAARHEGQVVECIANGQADALSQQMKAAGAVVNSMTPSLKSLFMALHGEVCP